MFKDFFTVSVRWLAVSARLFSALLSNTVIVYFGFLNHLECTANNTKLVHWPLMGGLRVKIKRVLQGGHGER